MCISLCLQARLTRQNEVCSTAACASSCADVQASLLLLLLLLPFFVVCCVQATGGRPRNSCCQTLPQSLPEEQAEELMGAPGFAAFLEAVRPRWVAEQSLRRRQSFTTDLAGQH